MNSINLRNRYVLIFTIFLIFFISCTSKSQVNEAVNNWYGKHLFLPNDSLIFNNNENKTQPLQKKIKVLTLINGSCGSCVKEFQEWKLFMKGIDTSYVGFIFLIHSITDIESFKNRVNLSIDFKYPFYKDIGNRIILKNKFIKNSMYQTFLIDDNIVILVGKPNTGSMYNLYRSEIDKRLKNHGIMNGVFGSIVNRSTNKSILRVPSSFTFKNEQGKDIDKDLAEQMIKTGNFMPSINDKTKVITLKKK